MVAKIQARLLGAAWNRLAAISDEVFINIVRTSFSTIVREARDACCVLMDPAGRAIVQSQGVPSFLGMLPMTMKSFLKKFPIETLQVGDIVATNDPWLGSGQVNDITLASPLFLNGKVIGFVGTTQHLMDVGGTGFNASSREVYEEGLVIPPMKIARRGNLNDELLDLISTNVRIPKLVLGDLRSTIASHRLAQTLLDDALHEFHVTDFGGLSGMIIRRTEEVMRREIGRITPGEYTGTAYVEGGEDEPEVKIVCTIEIGEGKVKVNFDGSSGCSSRGINVPFCYTYSWTQYSIKTLVAPRLPNNEGCYRCVDVKAPAESILNAPRPVAVGGRNLVGHIIPSAIFKALERDMPTEVIAESGGFTSMQFYGRNRKNGVFWLSHSSSGGMGAGSSFDGLNTTSFPTNVSNVPVEVIEDLYNLTVEKKELIRDSGGAGKHRGGLGQMIVLRNTTSNPVSVFLLCNRTRFAPEGLFGGRAGRVRYATVNGTRAEATGKYLVNPGGTVVLCDAGGGGYGNPSEREVSEVVNDVRNDYVSREEARKSYGIVIDSHGKGRRIAKKS